MSDEAVLVVCGGAVLFSLVAVVIALWAATMQRQATRAAARPRGFEPSTYVPAPQSPDSVPGSGIGRSEDRR